MDSRIRLMASQLVNYSVKLQKGEKILIDYQGEESKNLVKCVIDEAYKVGAFPYVCHRDPEIVRALMLGCSEEQLTYQNRHLLEQMRDMDAYMAIRGCDNAAEMSDVPDDKVILWNKVLDPVLRERVDHTKWVIMRYPNGAMAQMSNMSSEAFEDFYFDVCTMDYAKMSKAMDPLVNLMKRTDRVHLVGPGTDLTFSIKGIGAVKCDGKCNIPDGEVYSAPVRESVNGYITYNTPSLEMGFTYENIHFEIENGKIVKATANDSEKVNKLLDTDPGARYFGEFAIGVNPYVKEPLKDTLFDEKIDGSFHLTPGACYEDCWNGNHSAVHWDLVNIQRPEYGGGEIYFDDVLIRKDGKFVLPELDILNPENLK